MRVKQLWESGGWVIIQLWELLGILYLLIQINAARNECIERRKQNIETFTHTFILSSGFDFSNLLPRYFKLFYILNKLMGFRLK